MNKQIHEKLIHGISAVFLFFFLFVSPSYFYAATVSQTWTIHDTPMNGYWASVTWAPALHLFVAVGHNTVMTSPDGEVWTAGTIPSGEWNAITWSPELNLFVVVGFGHAESGNDAVTSPDGFVWTSQTTPVFTPITSPTPGDENSYGMWNSIVWSPQLGLFVAVGQNFTNSSNELIMTSSDGITWSFQNNVIDTVWNSVTWSPELNRFVAVGYENTTISSSDGITWEMSPPVGHIGGIGGESAAGSWSSVVWSPELGIFVAVSEQVNDQIVMTSTDGISWTLRAGVVGHYDWKSIAWSSELGIFTAVSVNNAFMISPDGIVWTDITPPANKTWSSITWSPLLGVFVVVANSGTAMTAATSDLLSPLITSVSSSSINSTSAVITWVTDISSDSQVLYGTSAEYGNSTSVNSSLVKNHSVFLSELANCTQYHYQVRSTYAGMTTTSSYEAFTTTGCTTIPSIVLGDVSSVSTEGATLTANVSNAGSSSISTRGFYYGESDSYGHTTTENGSFSTGEFSTVLTGLSPNTTYHYRAYAINDAGTGMNDTDATFTTNATAVSSGGGTTSGGGSGGGILTTIQNNPLPDQVEAKKVPITLFTKTLKIGIHDEDVIALQKFLNAHGFILTDRGPGSPGKETNFFGRLTWQTIVKLQLQYGKEILEPLLLKKPTGFFGPFTLKKTNGILIEESSR